MRVLVLGGAGYIGSHMVKYLLAAGDTVRVLDDLSTGHRAAVEGCPLIEASLLEPQALRAALAEFRPEVVMHFAARSIVPESARAPDLYYRCNVTGTLNLLDAMRATGVDKLIFSSTASVYGTPETVPITESAPLRPISVYGRTKLFMEEMIRDHARAFGLKAVSLRYFNAAGADASGLIGEAHEPETHLIPNILRAASGLGEPLTLFGDDHPTPDGTAIRDYIHVSDLANAHRLAARYLDDLADGAMAIFNLGVGQGYSVRQVLDCAEAVTGQRIPYTLAPARQGDPPVLVADASLARAQLGWQPVHSSLTDIVASAWRWHSHARY